MYWVRSCLLVASGATGAVGEPNHSKVSRLGFGRVSFEVGAPAMCQTPLGVASRGRGFGRVDGL